MDYDLDTERIIQAALLGELYSSPSLIDITIALQRDLTRIARTQSSESVQRFSVQMVKLSRALMLRMQAMEGQSALNGLRLSRRL